MLNRENALFEVKQSILTEWEKSFNQSAREASEAMEFIVNKIYDDIESRVCGNCEWYNDPICANAKCEDMNSMGQYVVRPTFGCNEFANKDGNNVS